MKIKLFIVSTLILSACSLTGTGTVPQVKTRQQTYVPSTVPVAPVETSTEVSGSTTPDTSVHAAESTTCHVEMNCNPNEAKESLKASQPDLSLFIFGDSTADHAVSTIARLGINVKAKAFISYQCPFLSSDWLTFGQKPLSDLVIPNTCSDWKTKGMDQMKEWKPDVVLLWQSSDQFDISCKKNKVCSLNVERNTFEIDVNVPVVFVHWPNWTNPNQKEIDVAQASLDECNLHRYCFDGTQLVESLTRPDRIHLATPEWGNTDSIGTFINVLLQWIKDNVK